MDHVEESFHGSDLRVVLNGEPAKKYQQQYPNILAIVDLVLTFSPSSAQAERGFSQLNIVKSNLRDRLGQNSLYNILAIKFLSNDIHSYNPDKDVDNFFMSKKKDSE